MKGRIVHDEVIFEIVDITLERGMIVFHAVATAPPGGHLRINANAEGAIFAPDGTLVLSAPGSDLPPQFEGASDGDHLYFTQTVVFSDHRGNRVFV